MRRRDFLGVMGAAATTWPLASRAQQWREYPAAGGLMSYGNDITEAFRLTGIHADEVIE